MFNSNQKAYRQFFIICAFFGSLLFGALTAAAQTSAFTYQGRLTDAGAPANGSYDLQFALFDAVSGGTQQGITVTKLGVIVTNGVFTALLDFTSAPFTAGADRYLEITVRNPAGGSAATLAPRQQITSAPTAIQAANAVNAQQLGGSAATNYLQTNGSGANLTNLNASNITSGGLNDSQLSANVALRNQANTFVGNQIVNGNLTQTGTVADLTLTNGFVVSGTLGTGVIPATGAGTRMMFYPGKAAFRAGDVDGTQWNAASVGGYSAAFGSNTIASGFGSTALGSGTSATGNSSLAAGFATTASGNITTALGYFVSTNNQQGSFIYGDSSTTTSFVSVAPNSFTMRATGGFASVGTFGTGAIPAMGAGTRMMFYPNKAAFRAGNVFSTEWDDANIGNYSTATGRRTVASGLDLTAMGLLTVASGEEATALGFSTTASGNESIAMGENTIASGANSTAIGLHTLASGFASVAVGERTTASGNFSTAMGRNASTNNQTGSFVYGDNSTSLGFNILSSAPNQFVVRAQNIWFGQNNGVINTANRFIETSTGAYLSTGGTWTNSSSVNLKTNFAPVDSRFVLQKVLTLPLTTWNYKSEDQSVVHLGAMAQDFRKAFDLGADDEHISTVDADGVALAAIQGLNAEVKDEMKLRDIKFESQQTQIETQQTTIERQQKQIDALVKLVCASNSAADVCRQEEKIK